MTSAPAHRSHRYWPPPIWLAALSILVAIFPPFHIRRLGADVEGLSNPPVAGNAPAFDAQKFAESAWKDQLVPSAARATDLVALMDALAGNPVDAQQRFGRRIGIGGKTFYFVRGEAQVRSIDRKGVWLNPERERHAPVSIRLVMGPIFGNALRDGTGLLKTNSLSSFDANAASVALNQIAERSMQPILAKAVPGNRIRFAGCAEAEDAGGQWRVKVVPVVVEYAP